MTENNEKKKVNSEGSFIMYKWLSFFLEDGTQQKKQPQWTGPFDLITPIQLWGQKQKKRTFVNDPQPIRENQLLKDHKQIVDMASTHSIIRTQCRMYHTLCVCYPRFLRIKLKIKVHCEEY